MIARDDVFAEFDARLTVSSPAEQVTIAITLLECAWGVELHAPRYDPESAVELAGVLGFGSPFNRTYS
jgi:hypothetical protein